MRTPTEGASGDAILTLIAVLIIPHTCTRIVCIYIVLETESKDRTYYGAVHFTIQQQTLRPLQLPLLFCESSPDVSLSI